MRYRRVDCEAHLVLQASHGRDVVDHRRMSANEQIHAVQVVMSREYQSIPSLHARKAQVASWNLVRRGVARSKQDAAGVVQQVREVMGRRRSYKFMYRFKETR